MVKKATASQMACYECNKSIEKGEEMIDIRYNNWRGLNLIWKHFHVDCFWLALVKIVKRPRGNYLKGFQMAVKLLEKLEEK